MHGEVTSKNRWLVLIAVMLAFLPVVLDMTILHVAVPVLTQSLNSSGNETLWIIDVYPLLMAGLLVPMGTLADRIGNRKLLLTGLFIFGAASVWAAFAANAAMLIAARIVLAFGGSMIMPCVLGLIRKTFADEKERAMALGLWGMVAAAGAAIGPLIGGALLQHFWWGSVFLVNVPIMLIVFPACYFLLSRKENVTYGKWAIGHAIMLILGMMSLVYGIKAGFGGTQSFTVATLVAGFGMIMLYLFVRRQIRSDTPLLDLSLMSNPVIVSGIIMAIFVAGALAGVELTLAQELQYVLEKTPLQAGVFMVPIMAGAAVGGPIAGFLSNRFGLRLVSTLSLLISATALLILANSDFSQSGSGVPIALAVVGITLSIGLTSSSIAIMGSVDESKGGAAGSLEATGHELGTGLGITFFGVFMSTLFSRYLDLPPSLSDTLSANSPKTIGDAFIIAKKLPEEQATLLIEAGKTAFTNTHSMLLSTAAIGIGLLAFILFFTLRNFTQLPHKKT